MVCHQSKITKAFMGISFASLILLSLSFAFTAPAFAEQVAVADDVPEVELYQDGSGEWKVKYLNTDPAPSADSAVAVNSDNLEVELYQDQSGEWKVKYVSADANASQSAQAKTAQETDSGAAKEATAEVAKAAQAKPAKVDAKEIMEDKVVEVVKTIPAKPMTEEKAQAVKASSSSGVPQKTMDKKSGDVLAASKPISTGESELKSVTKTQPKPKVTPEPKPKMASRSAEPVKKIDTSAYEFQPEEYIRNPNHRFELGVQVSQYHFEQEPFANNLNVLIGKTNEGRLYGLHAGYEQILTENSPKRSLTELFQHIEDVNRYKFTLDYQTGSTEYSDINENPKQDFTQQILEGRAVAGYDFMATRKTRVTPFFGVGYRYQLDPSGSVFDIPISTLVAGDDQSEYDPINPFFNLRQPYEVHTHNLYLPFGVMTNTDITDSLSVGLNLEMDVLIWGMIKSNFSDLGDIYSENMSKATPGSNGQIPNPRTVKLKNTTNQLRGGFGFKGSTRITKKQRVFDWYVEPYIRYWHINESDEEQFPLNRSDGKKFILFKDQAHTIPYNWTEPESSTTEYGVQVGVSY